MSIVMNPAARENDERPASQDRSGALHPLDRQDHIINEEESLQTVHSPPKMESDEWNIHNAKSTPVPAAGLCMYHCVHAAKDLDWMKHRHECCMVKRSDREKADEARSKALRKQIIAFIVTKGKVEVAKRFEILRSEGHPSTEEMPYFAHWKH